MFKNHPKGLLTAAITNMGERFGFYIMMAILVLFLQAKFGLSAEDTGLIYATFYFLIYFLALVGGILADKVLGLNRTIFIGITTMVAGYLVIAIPGMSLEFTCAGLLIIALGNGLFKGNLQALVGNLYEPAQYAALRDRAFSIFYMCINIGAIFAPAVAKGVRDWFIGTQGFSTDDKLPALAHNVINNGTSAITPDFLARASNVTLNKTVVTAETATQFANDYISAFTTGYNYAFGIAAVAMLISLSVYILRKKDLLPGMSVHQASSPNAPSNVAKISPAETRERISVLIFVFLIVIFFWMSFHQNGLTLTFYARDYTQQTVGAYTNLLFDLWAMLPIVIAIFGVGYAVSGSKPVLNRGLSLALAGAAGWFAYNRIMAYTDTNTISPEIFQQFNPMFVVLLTPVAIAFFAFLNKRNCEPSAPRKIGIGMIIASIAFVILLIASMGQFLPSGLGLDAQGVQMPNSNLSTPYLLISTYFILTIAELFLSPMGISFVSKVAPPQYKGLMQGGWLCATAIGNWLVAVGSSMWGKLDSVWQVWCIFAVCCMISAMVIFAYMKRLEKVAK